MTSGSTPDINTLVDVRLSGDRDYPSRIEDVGDKTWTRPRTRGSGHGLAHMR